MKNKRIPAKMFFVSKICFKNEKKNTFFQQFLEQKRIGLFLNNCSEKKVKYFIIIRVLSQCMFIMLFYKKNQY